jgi:hypothetical protein
MNAHEMYNGIKILLLLLLVASLIVTGASVRAQQDGVLLNATMGLVTTHLTFRVILTIHHTLLIIIMG